VGQISYELVRSNRKTLAMEITPEGKLLVRAPKRCSKGYIDAFVESKSDWVEKHLPQVQAQVRQRENFYLKTGDTLSFCGAPLRVVVNHVNMARLDLARREITLPDVPVIELRSTVEKLYRRGGLGFIQTRLAYWAQLMGISYGKVTLSGAIRRWGSCSYQGDIRISWMLLFASSEAIDYVLVHELAHRREFNHSARFWAVVETYLPDWRQRRQELRQLQAQLFAQGWSAK
jgi:hypothetical protein